MASFNDTEACKVFHEFAVSLPSEISSWLQISFSFLSNSVLLTAWCIFGVAPGIEHTVKMLLSYSYSFILCHNSFTLINQIRNRIVYGMATDCQLFTAWSCMITRIPQLFCFIALTLTYLTLVYDRAYCTWRPLAYETKGLFSSSYYLCWIILLSGFLTSAVIIEAPIIPYRPYCTLTNETGSERFNYLLRSLLILSVIYSFVLLALSFKNNHNMTNNVHGFNVNMHYQMRTNQLAIRFVTVSSLTSLFVSVMFLAGNLFARVLSDNIGKVAFHAYLEFTFITPIHGFMSAFVIIFYGFCRRKQQLCIDPVENLTKDHFDRLQRLWS